MTARAFGRLKRLLALLLGLAALTAFPALAQNQAAVDAKLAHVIDMAR